MAHDSLVHSPNLQVDLSASKRPQNLLRLPHQRRSNAVTPNVISNGNRVEPTTMSVVTSHDGTDDTIILNGNEQQVGLKGDLCWNCDLGPVPRRVVRESFLPKAPSRH
jgi:hypothetical protein